ncbi:CdaR family protein [Anaerofustis sp.]|uniref:CdaR family protein n=1 Tax=Anaerofustis sp. TaxID=1872517 RepID=UPI0025B9CDF8|nr:CdaR family protein [Anaerofustis sp.]
MEKNNSKVMTLLISFLLSVLLWGYAISDSDNMTYSRIENIPISASNTGILDQNDFIVSLSKDKIDSMKVYGKGSLVKSLNNQNIHASVDLKDISAEGTYTLNINIKGIPSDVTIVDQEPNVIKVKVEKKGSKDISVPVIKPIGNVKGGYSVLSLSPETKNVHISGPSSSVEKVSAIVGNVDVENKNEDFTSDISLYAVDENNKKISDVDLFPSSTNVSVLIGRIKEVKVNVISKGKVAEGYKLTDISANKETVIISGVEEKLENIDIVNTESIDLSDRKSSFDKNVSLDLPQGVHVVDAKDSIDVSVKIDKLNEKTIYITSFTFDNLAEGLKAEVIDDKVSVLLSGDNSLLNKISEKNLSGSLDLSGLNEGTHSVAIKISTQGIPEGVNIRSVSQNNITVKITRGK